MFLKKRDYICSVIKTQSQMENTLCIVSAQYYDENGKAKGEQQFTLRVDSDTFMYTKQQLLKDAIQSIIEENFPYAGRVEYRSHELVFSEPIACVNSLDERIEHLYENGHKEQIQYND